MTNDQSKHPQASLFSHESVVLKTKHGDIIFKFYPQKAPQTVSRIKELINSEYYKNMIFHRVVDGFVVQTGDPTGTGTGGSGKKLQAEFNDLKHELGTVAMARSSNPHSADSQFYIALDKFPHLDGQYTIFGQVVSGIDILTKIKQGDAMISLSLQNEN